MEYIFDSMLEENMLMLIISLFDFFFVHRQIIHPTWFENYREMKSKYIVHIYFCPPIMIWILVFESILWIYHLCFALSETSDNWRPVSKILNMGKVLFSHNLKIIYLRICSYPKHWLISHKSLGSFPGIENLFTHFYVNSDFCIMGIEWPNHFLPN